MDGRRRTWLAVDAFYYGAPLAAGLRERFGITGVAVFDAYLRACKRNDIEGQVTYLSQADFLAQLGLPGLDLRDEQGVPWDLDAFWSYLGRMKNVRRTRSGHITNVRSTRWERWQQSRSRARNVGPLPTEYADDAQPDKDRRQDTDTENYNDTDNSDVVVVEGPLAVPDAVWSEYARRAYARQPAGSVAHPLRWMQATERKAREEHGLRAEHLLRNFDISIGQLADVLLGEGSPRWLEDCRKAQ